MNEGDIDDHGPIQVAFFPVVAHHLGNIAKHFRRKVHLDLLDLIKSGRVVVMSVAVIMRWPGRRIGLILNYRNERLQRCNLVVVFEDDEKGGTKKSSQRFQDI